MSKKAEAINHGRVLEKIVAWSGLTQDNFAKRIGMSRVWLYSAFQDERIREKNRIRINKEFNLPEGVWEDVKLLPVGGVGEVNEAVMVYHRTELQTLRNENELQREEILMLNKKLVSAYELIEELRTEIKTIRNQRY